MAGHGWAALEKVGQARRRAIKAVFLAVVAAFGFGTLARVQVWREEIAFFRDFVRTSPRFAGAHFNLGRAYGKAGRFPEAAAAYEEALRIDPTFPQARHDVALLYLGFDMTDRAREHCRELEKIDPEAARRLRTMIEFVAR
jgi:tetratricopeptide (TPR) repeat protein